MSNGRSEMDGDAPHVESPRRANGTAAVSSITFHNLSYEVTQRKLHKRLPNKTILNSVRLGIQIGAARITLCSGLL